MPLKLVFKCDLILKTLFKYDLQVGEYGPKRLNHTFRLIDGTTTIHSDTIFQEHLFNINPDSLVLNKDNIYDNSARVIYIAIDSKGNYCRIDIST